MPSAHVCSVFSLCLPPSWSPAFREMFSSQPGIIKQLLTKSLEITAQRQNQITLQGPQEKVKVTSPPPLETLADSQLAETTVNPRLKNRGNERSPAGCCEQ